MSLYICTDITYKEYLQINHLQRLYEMRQLDALGALRSAFKYKKNNTLLPFYLEPFIKEKRGK